MFVFLFYFDKKKLFSLKLFDLIFMTKSMLMLRENGILLSIFYSCGLNCGPTIQLLMTFISVSHKLNYVPRQCNISQLL